MEPHRTTHLAQPANLLTVLLLGGLLLSWSGCGSDAPRTPPAEKTGQLQIVCTTGQIGDMLTRIGGKHVTVETLMGPATDPHRYEASRADLQRLAAADLIFINGLNLEARLKAVLDEQAEQRPVYAVTHDLREKGDRWLRKVAASKDTYDPHVWLDASLWARCVDDVATRLTEQDKAHAADYRRNADRMIAELESLHLLCKQQVAQIPQEKRVLVTAHDAFGYFGGACGMETYGLQGFSTADEVDQEAVNDLADLLVARNIQTVFVENGLSDQGIQTLIKACRDRGHEVTIGGELYSGALGPPGTKAGTYVGAMEHNVTTIAQALRQ